MPANRHILPERDATTTVTAKGRVTIPKTIRDLLGIKPGNAVRFKMASDGRVVISNAGTGAGQQRRVVSAAKVE